MGKIMPSLALLLLIGLNSAFSMKVLILHPVYAGSHLLSIQVIAKQLLAREHQVTTVHFRDKGGINTLPGHENQTFILRSVDNSDGSHPYMTAEKEAQFEVPQDLIWSKGLSVWTLFRMKNPWRVMDGYCDSIFQPDFMKQLGDEKFDVAIVDLIYNECGLVLAHKLGLPAVAYWAFSFSGGEQTMSTGPAPPSYVPEFMSLLTDRMNFLQRLENTARKMFDFCLMTYHTGYIDRISRKHFPDVPSSKDLLANLSGVMINTDFVLDYPRPMPPTFINIGGITVKEPKPLPADLQEYLDAAKDGAVLFTMGFIFNPNTVPTERVQTFLNSFRRLPFKVIMKFDLSQTEHKYDVPDNVLMAKWLPQADILGHKNLRVFLTHCGMHGIMEAIHMGVPMVGMPVFVDQGDVLTRMMDRGVAVGLSKSSTEDEIYSAIMHVANTPSYKENVLRLSKLLRMRKNNPLEDAVWLIEHVAETHGADHLKLASRHLNFIEYNCIDTLLVILLVLAVVIMPAVTYLIRRILQWSQLLNPEPNLKHVLGTAIVVITLHLIYTLER